MNRLKHIRLAELHVVSDIFEAAGSDNSRTGSVVEIGGGSGFLAKEMAAMGLSVMSFDPSPRQPLEFSVQEAFGHDLPVDDGIADIVFAAHVMEHVPEPFLGPTFDEIRRVLRPSGQAIILLPTSSAMFFTILLQPLGNFRRLMIHLRRVLGGDYSPKQRTYNNPLSPKGESFPVKLIKSLTLRWFLPEPHGAGKSSLHELWNWRRSNWLSTFARFGFGIREVRPSGLAFSNHQLMGERLWSLRSMLGRLGMSGSQAFILRPNPEPIDKEDATR